MPHPVTPASTAKAPTIFPGNLSGMKTPEAKGEHDFAEFLQGSQNINGMPGGVAKHDTVVAEDGESAGDSAQPQAAITFTPDNENGEPAEPDAQLVVEGENLLPLDVLTGEKKAVDQALAASTIGKLPQIETSPEQAELAVGTEETPDALTVQNGLAAILNPQAPSGTAASPEASEGGQTALLNKARGLKAEIPAKSNPVAVPSGVSDVETVDAALSEIAEIAQQTPSGQQAKPAVRKGSAVRRNAIGTGVERNRSDCT